MSKLYGCLPSTILGIDDDYTAFCFNSACANILVRIQNDEKPHYIEHKAEQEEPKHYENFKDFYKNIGG